MVKAKADKEQLQKSVPMEQMANVTIFSMCLKERNEVRKSLKKLRL